MSEATLSPCLVTAAELKDGDPLWMVLEIWTSYTKAHQDCADRHRVLSGAVRKHNELAGSKPVSGTN